MVKVLPFVVVSLLQLGCSPSGSTAPAASATVAPSAAPSGGADATGPLVWEAGRADAFFQGDCTPAGSRGGCYSLTLRKDGSFRQVLLDASQSGTYVVEGNVLVLSFAKGGPEPQRLKSVDGWKTLSNGYKREPMP